MQVDLKETMVMKQDQGLGEAAEGIGEGIGEGLGEAAEGIGEGLGEAVEGAADEIAGKRGMVVKKRSKKNKYKHGGKVKANKKGRASRKPQKGMTIIIAVGKPKINRKSKRR